MQKMQKMALLYTQISPLPYLWINKGEFHLPTKLAEQVGISEQAYDAKAQ